MNNCNEALRADLEPCPFCGGRANYQETHVGHWRVLCMKCGATNGTIIARCVDPKPALDAAWNRRPSPVAGGDLREAVRKEARVAEMSANIMRDPKRTGNWDGAQKTAAAFDRIARSLRAALNQPAAPVEADLLDRAELAWQRFFYPAADCFTGPIGDKLPSVDLEVADCLRLVLAAIGRHVAAPDQDVPALMVEYPSREGQIKTVAEKLAAFTGAPYEDWRHFIVEAGDIIDRLSVLAHPPEPAASTVAQGEAA